MVKKYFPIIVLSFLSSMIGMLVFYHFFNPIHKVYIEQEQRALKTAEREIQFSPKFINSYRSASPTSFVEAARISRDAVVFIRSLKAYQSENENNTYSASTGSGVIITDNGYIVTNNHVIENAEEIEVILNSNKEYKAILIGTDPSTDLALLKIETEELPYLRFGNSDSLSVGEWVMAVGNPFRLQSTVTAGIVSAKARDINILENYGVESFIQTDAAVNPGNSGGALVNTIGELIGINAAIMTYSGKYEGFSFAIPSNLVHKVITDLREFGSVQRGWMGISINDVNDDMAKKLGLDKVEGVLISGVNKNGGADKAGFEIGDVILTINGTPALTVPSFMEMVARYRPGDVIELEYYRDGNNLSTSVTLLNQLNSTEIITIRKDEILQKLGVELRDLEDSEKQIHKHGAYVISIKEKSILAETNMDPGFIIKKINNQDVYNVEDLVTYLESNKGEFLVEGFYVNYPGEFPYRFSLK